MEGHTHLRLVQLLILLPTVSTQTIGLGCRLRVDDCAQLQWSHAIKDVSNSPRGESMKAVLVNLSTRGYDLTPRLMPELV